MTVAALLWIVALVTGASGLQPPGMEDTLGVMERALLFPTLPIALPWVEDAACRRDSETLLQNLRNQTLWAVKMLDASAVRPFGILEGNRYHLGSFDECLTVRHPIRAQYCAVEVRVSAPDAEGNGTSDVFDLDPDPSISVWRRIENSRLDPSQNPRDTAIWGLCVPESCSAEVLQSGLKTYLRSMKNNEGSERFQVTIPEGYCQSPDELPVTAGEVGFWVVTAVLVGLVAVSTLRDALAHYGGYKDKIFTWLAPFSAPNNIRSLLDVSGVQPSPYLTPFCCLKVISICFIIHGHHILVHLGTAILNGESVERELRGSSNVFLPHSDLAVDSFFFFGGLILSLSIVAAFKKRAVNVGLVFLYRITRLAPLYYFIVWFQASAILRLGSGPGWRSMMKAEIDNCADNWWANILFIQNYVNAKKMCFLHAWYLPCDLHLFILSVLLLFFMQKHRRAGGVLLAVLIGVAVVIPGLITYWNNLPPSIIFYHKFLNNPREDPVYEMVYTKTHARAAVYLIGVAAGCFLDRTQHSTKRIPLWVSLLGCFLWVGLMFAPMAYGSQYYDPRRQYSLLESSVFASLRRLSWALAWVSFLLVHRFGTVPIVGDLFSWKLFIPLSRLTYGVYLVHFVMQAAEQAKAKVPQHFSVYDSWLKGTNDVSFSFVYAAVLYLVVEQPFKLIFKQLLFSRQATRNLITAEQQGMGQSEKTVTTIVTERL